MQPKQTLYLRLEGDSGVLRVEVAPLARLLGNTAAEGAMSARVQSCTTGKCSPSFVRNTLRQECSVYQDTNRSCACVENKSRRSTLATCGDAVQVLIGEEGRQYEFALAILFQVVRITDTANCADVIMVSHYNIVKLGTLRHIFCTGAATETGIGKPWCRPGSCRCRG